MMTLVGHAGDELAEGRHLGDLHELGLGVAQAREAVLGRGVEARVLEGQRGLVGEGLQRLQLVGRELAPGAVAEAQRADDALVRVQRDGHDRAQVVVGQPRAHVRR